MRDRRVVHAVARWLSSGHAMGCRGGDGRPLMRPIGIGFPQRDYSVRFAPMPEGVLPLASVARDIVEQLIAIQELAVDERAPAVI